MPSLLKVSRWSLVRKEPILEKKKNYSQLTSYTTLGSLTYDCAVRGCRPRWPLRWFQQRYLLQEVRPGPLPQLLQVVWARKIVKKWIWIPKVPHFHIKGSNYSKSPKDQKLFLLWPSSQHRRRCLLFPERIEDAVLSSSSRLDWGWWVPASLLYIPAPSPPAIGKTVALDAAKLWNNVRTPYVLPHKKVTYRRCLQRNTFHVLLVFAKGPFLPSNLE